MWVRTLLKCRLCGKVTNLRLGISGPPQQEVKFECLGCRTTIGGTLYIDYENIETSFKPINCTEVQGDPLSGGDYFVEYSFDRPVAKPSSQPHHLLTPYLRQFPETGGALDLIARTRWSQSISSADWYNFHSLNNAYIQQNYATFRKIASIYLTEKYPMKKRIELQRAFYQLHYLFLTPYIPIEKNHNLVLQMTNYICQKNDPFVSEIQVFVDHLFAGGYLQAWQKDITEILDNFADNRDWLAPFAVHLMTSKASRDYWLPTEHYSRAKQFYTDMFEVLGRLLIAIIGLNNIKYRSSYQAMPGNMPKSVKTWEDFAELSNGLKFRFCQENPFWVLIYNDAFDHKLRNGINHNKAYLDDISQVISYFPDKQGKKCFQIKYYDFIVHTIRTFWALFDMHQLVKIVLVRYFLSSSDRYQEAVT